MLHQQEHTLQKYALQEPNSGLPSASAPAVALRSTDAVDGNHFDFTFEAVRPGIFRTTFSSPSHPLPPFPSAQRLEPSFKSEPRSGSGSGSGSESGSPKTTLDTASRTFSVSDGNVTATVDWTDAPVVSLHHGGIGTDTSAEKPLYRDMAYRSYVADGQGVAHYSSYSKGGLYVGLGEKAGPMNLAGRGFQITASDTFGYDALRTDPLYKHIPLLLHISPPSSSGSGGHCVGLFSTSHSRGTWNVGSEIDGMWGHFKVYRQAYGGLEQYLLVGRSVADVVRLYADVVGYPLLVPRYMMGYVGGGMMYSMMDGPPLRAADVIVKFIDDCAAHDIPVSAFQMSSGYTINETPPKTRNVFTWNRHRFPDPRAFTAACHARGVRLLANIKPYVLANHPAYPALKAANAFFRDPSASLSEDSQGLQTGIARLWSAGGGESGEGSHLDFTSKAAFQWWYDGCRALKAVGIDAMWNDNNEYNIFSDDWECALETVPAPPSSSPSPPSKAAASATLPAKVGLWGRAMHTELMGKSSHDACVHAAPDERPLVLTRSATAGTMRYACSSWSGDNVTSWDGMRGANAMSLNAGVSLLSCYGHDIGGFEGPQPTAEHLVRWVQLGVHQPRFAINCYKTSEADNLVGGVIEPWMHPTATPHVRSAIKRRYELMPYTYSGALQSHLTALPSMRWTGWGYEADPEVWTAPLLEGDTQFWFGDALLIGGVYAPGEATARVYLPKAGVGADNSDAGFLNVNAPHEWLAAGAWHTISAAWHASIPVLARCGSAVPVGRNLPTTSRKEGSLAEAEQAEFPGMALDDWRGVEVYPPPVTATAVEATAAAAAVDSASASAGGSTNGFTFTNTWLEDDGISAQGRCPIYEITLTYSTSSSSSSSSSSATIVVVASATVKVVAATTVEGGAAASWQPLWLAHGIDVILPIGEERTVRGEAGGGGDVTDKGRDAKGRRVHHIEVKVRP